MIETITASLASCLATVAVFPSVPLCVPPMVGVFVALMFIERGMR